MSEFLFQDTDPFKSKENLFSSSETGELFWSFSFLLLIFHFVFLFFRNNTFFPRYIRYAQI